MARKTKIELEIDNEKLVKKIERLEKKNKDIDSTKYEECIDELKSKIEWLEKSNKSLTKVHAEIKASVQKTGPLDVPAMINKARVLKSLEDMAANPVNAHLEEYLKKLMEFVNERTT